MPLHTLQALDHLGLLKPTLCWGLAMQISEVPCELPGGRQVMCFQAIRGKASSRHDAAKGRCHGGAGWHPATDRTG